MNILITAPNQAPIKATLADNAAARDFYTLLPLTVQMEDYASKEKVAHNLPRKLNTTGTLSEHNGKRGDITYYAPWGNLAVFYRDHGSAASGLVYLGNISEDVDAINNLNGQVHISIDNQ
ncbi:cyclophilin-like fold protein [Actinobacillus capsulatus]|uniref:cyclophilin-like fold protein n=1 Tax=Actinobacillus capsulatus TaxID=717 RepID=UPI0003A2C0B2|nr:cyclophilin-like fold protein [Actinobacillus capsulatus]